MLALLPPSCLGMEWQAPGVFLWNRLVGVPITAHLLDLIGPGFDLAPTEGLDLGRVPVVQPVTGTGRGVACRRIFTRRRCLFGREST